MSDNEKLDEMLINIKSYAYFKARRRKLEEYKKILMYNLMKEIGIKYQNSIVEQKKMAIASPEYKRLLSNIRDCNSEELVFLWKLKTYEQAVQTYSSEQYIERQNNLNIHNN